MAVHIFSVNEENYRVCIRRSLVGLPEPGNTSRKNSTLDGLISRLSAVRDNDYILMYVTGKKNSEDYGKQRAEHFMMRPLYGRTRFIRCAARLNVRNFALQIL